MPKIDYSKCNHIEATKRGHEYNDTHDIALEEITPLKRYLHGFFAEKKSHVFASSMPRALLTAKAAFGEKFNIIGEERFIEFDLKFLPIPFVSLKFGTWAVISRILWFAGLLKTKRSFRNERLRAKKASEFIYEKAQDSSVALVAHGMLNLFIEKDLKNKGYKRVSKVRNGFFSITTLTRDH